MKRNGAHEINKKYTNDDGMFFLYIRFPHLLRHNYVLDVVLDDVWSDGEFGVRKI